MAEQVHAEVHEAKEAETEIETKPVDLANPELTEDVENLLDEIDDLLEENAEQFVRNYVQKGGE